jgi:hypothetical protein
MNHWISSHFATAGTAAARLLATINARLEARTLTEGANVNPPCCRMLVCHRYFKHPEMCLVKHLETPVTD